MLTLDHIMKESLAMDNITIPTVQKNASPAARTLKKVFTRQAKVIDLGNIHAGIATCHIHLSCLDTA